MYAYAKLTEYNSALDLFAFEIKQDLDSPPEKVELTGQQLEEIRDQHDLLDGAVSPRDACIAMIFEDQDNPAELIGRVGEIAL